MNIDCKRGAMPSPKHKCARLDCEKMISAASTHCRNHVPRTREWIERQAKTQRGKKLSLETRQKISKSRSVEYIPKICQWCNEAFSVKPSYDAKGENHGKYCSSKCAYAARSGENSRFWKGGKKEYTCKLCGKLFYRQPCFVTGKNVFCSYSCNSIYKKSRQRIKRTGIEKKMAQALIDAGFDFQEQVPLCNTTITDFYLPQFKLAIFCDGNYWHNYPNGKPRDKIQTQILLDNGYKVLRFWGSKINSDIDQCIQQIRSATS